MIEPPALLVSYVQGIRTLSGAAAATLYVSGPVRGIPRPLLIHDGDLEPVPELADLDAARAFTEENGVPPQGGEEDDGEPAFLSSADPDCGLVPLPSVHTPVDPGVFQAFETRRRSDAGEAQGDKPPVAWLGLRFPPGERPLLDPLDLANLSQELHRGDDSSYWWQWLFALGGALASHASEVSAILKDPITGLPDRKEFQVVLAERFRTAVDESQPLTLLLINPDEFITVNERFGREAGDLCIQEISDRLREALRATDVISRYGGVIFAAILVDTPIEEAREVAQRVLQTLTEAAFLEGAVRLGFSIGLSILEPGDRSIRLPLDLIRRSDQALNTAKRLGGGVVGWQEGAGAEELGSFDRLTGIFTGNMAKDYRNMVLLWDAVSVIALDPDFDDLVEQVVAKLFTTFKPRHLGLFSTTIDGLSLLRGLTRLPAGSDSQQRLETCEPDPKGIDLMRRAVAEGEVQEDTGCGPPSEGSTREVECSRYAVPLMAGGDCLGCLYLDGREDELGLDASDMMFLKALASQVAVAMDRTRLAELESRRQEQERKQLRAELNDLRRALQQAKMVYRSPEMETLIATVRRVAPTDATVLITGQSGTGKELLARTIHEFSPRKSLPFVIVDCGSIPSTLIESELFGHEKGAYTGAQQRRRGRLAEANHGTVLLDEVGELPLEVQSKLLRFVQDKQFTSVGGSKTQTVDVRILAATNRELATEVAAGRFREDLYYRLHVIHLNVPPLKNRPADILHLARHFLETYSVRYQKNVRKFSPRAEEALMACSWPGNVRELQNRIMQAVILSEGDQLQPADLGFTDDGRFSVPRPPVAPPEGASTMVGPITPEPAESAAPSFTDGSGETAEESRDSIRGADSLEVLLDHLRSEVGQQVESAANGGSPATLPLGRWLSEDLLLVADQAAGGVARRAAGLLGIPESTFRRRLRKARQRISAGESQRPEGWEAVRRTLERLLHLDEAPAGDLLALSERVLLEEILVRFPKDVRTGSYLLAVTAPTFRRRVAALSADTPA